MGGISGGSKLGLLARLAPPWLEVSPASEQSVDVSLTCDFGGASVTKRKVSRFGGNDVPRRLLFRGASGSSWRSTNVFFTVILGKATSNERCGCGLSAIRWATAMAQRRTLYEM